MNRKTQTEAVESISKSVKNFFSGVGFILKYSIVLAVLGISALWMYGIVMASIRFDAPLLIVTGTLILLVPFAVMFGISKLGQRVSE